MTAEPGWHLDRDPPSWSDETESFSFFLRKAGRERVLCTVTMGALLKAAPLSDLSEPGLRRRVFDAHRQMIELRAAEKLNAGRSNPDGSVLLDADDF